MSVVEGLERICSEIFSSSKDVEVDYTISSRKPNGEFDSPFCQSNLMMTYLLSLDRVKVDSDIYAKYVAGEAVTVKIIEDERTGITCAVRAYNTPRKKKKEGGTAYADGEAIKYEDISSNRNSWILPGWKDGNEYAIYVPRKPYAMYMWGTYVGILYDLWIKLYGLDEKVGAILTEGAFNQVMELHRKAKGATDPKPNAPKQQTATSNGAQSNELMNSKDNVCVGNYFCANQANAFATFSAIPQTNGVIEPIREQLREVVGCIIPIIGAGRRAMFGQNSTPSGNIEEFLMLAGYDEDKAKQAVAVLTGTQPAAQPQAPQSTSQGSQSSQPRQTSDGRQTSQGQQSAPQTPSAAAQPMDSEEEKRRLYDPSDPLMASKVRILADFLRDSVAYDPDNGVDLETKRNAVNAYFEFERILGMIEEDNANGDNKDFSTLVVNRAYMNSILMRHGFKINSERVCKKRIWFHIAPSSTDK